MFSQCFIAPLFEESVVERKVNAIESENERDRQDDIWRYQYVMQELSNHAHPIWKYCGGSKETLWDRPRANGVDARARMIEFFNKFYSANLMNLCIVAPYELDMLQDWIVELFSDVKNLNTPNPCDAFRLIPVQLPEHQCSMIYQETIEDVRTLVITWLTPSFAKDYKSKPMTLIRRLLEEKSKGSIRSLLKSKGCGGDIRFKHNDDGEYGLSFLSVSLTEKGIDHIEDVVSIVYDYLRLMRSTGISKWMYEEEKTIRATAFRFRDRGSMEDLGRTSGRAVGRKWGTHRC